VSAARVIVKYEGYCILSFVLLFYLGSQIVNVRVYYFYDNLMQLKFYVHGKIRFIYIV